MAEPLLRSLLFVPGDSERKLEKSLASGADILLLDLEDSVAGDRKAAARETVLGFLRTNAGAGPERWVRVNALGAELVDDDLAGVMAGAPAGIMLPKCVGMAELQRFSVKLRVAEAQAGLADGSTRLLPLIAETAAGVLAAAGWSGAHPRLAGVTWGGEDLAADIGARASRDEGGGSTDVFRLARSLTLLAAAASGVPAVDTVYADFRNAEALLRECIEAERDGFTAKLAIHPAQVPIINEAFTPSSEAVEEAEAIVEAFRAAGDPGVLGIGGRMFDRPHLRRAERILARARVLARETRKETTTGVVDAARL